MQMFDEEIATAIKADGTVEQKRWLMEDSLQAEEAEAAVADLVKSWREFRGLNAEGPCAIHDNKWWRALEYLALADSRLKELFCGRDLSPRSIAQYHKYRLKLCAGRRYRTDA